MIIIWPEDWSCPAKHIIFNEEMVKLVWQSGKPLFIEDEAKVGMNYGYIPVIEKSKSNDLVIAIVQLHYPSNSGADERFRRHVEGAIRAVGRSVKKSQLSVSFHSNASLSSKLAVFEGDCHGKDFFEAKSRQISDVLSSALRADVCLMRKENSQSAYEVDSVYYVGAVFRWRSGEVIPDNTTTTIPASVVQEYSEGAYGRRSLLGQQRNNTGANVVIRTVDEHLLVVESNERMNSANLALIDVFSPLLSSLGKQHYLRHECSSLNIKLAVQKGLNSILTATTEESLYDFISKMFATTLGSSQSYDLVWVDERAISEADSLRKRLLAAGFSSQSKQSLCALCLSSGAPIASREAVDGLKGPMAFVPVLLASDRGLAIVIIFDSSSSLNRFMAPEQEKNIISSFNADELMRLSSIIADKYQSLKHMERHDSFRRCVSAMTKIHSSVSKFIADCCGMKDRTRLESTLAQPLSQVETLALCIIEHNLHLHSDDVVREFRLHWQEAESRDQAVWMSHTSLPVNSKVRSPHATSPGDRFQSASLVFNPSPAASETLNSMAEEGTKFVSTDEDFSVFVSVSSSVVLEIKLFDDVKPVILDIISADWKNDDNLKGLFEKTLMSLQTSLKMLFSTWEKSSEQELEFMKTQSTAEAERIAMDILSDCIFDIYDLSTADLEKSRTDACIQAAHFHLSRLSAARHVDIEYISPSGQVHSIFQKSYPRSPSPITQRLYDTFSSPKLASLASTKFAQSIGNPSVSQEIAFECHDIKGKITVALDPDSLGASEESTKLVSKIVAKVLSRRLYELDKSYRNKVSQKKQSEELSKRR